jgi:hypothetical protein
MIVAQILVCSTVCPDSNNPYLLSIPGFHAHKASSQHAPCLWTPRCLLLWWSPTTIVDSLMPLLELVCVQAFLPRGWAPKVHIFKSFTPQCLLSAEFPCRSKLPVRRRAQAPRQYHRQGVPLGPLVQLQCFPPSELERNHSRLVLLGYLPQPPQSQRSPPSALLPVPPRLLDIPPCCWERAQPHRVPLSAL